MLCGPGLEIRQTNGLIRTASLAAIWIGVASVAFYDACFAWDYRTEMSSWELNPVATWGVQAFGVLPVLAFKAGELVFCVGLALYCHRRYPHLANRLTVTVGCLYLLLGIHYAIAAASIEGVCSVPPERLIAVAH
jgi:hypothetical protein